MKLSNYIKYLQESLEEHGGLTVVYASDDDVTDENKALVIN